MVFQPVIPLSGFGGWNFLQTTYDSQLDTYSKSPQIKNDIDYFTEKFAEPMAVEDFLSDGRLRRISMTAFGLAGEEWKTGYVRTVLEEVQKPESTFLARLNNPQYSRFAEEMRPVDGKILLTLPNLERITARFAAEAFELAVGEQDNAMRLSLNYKDEITELVTDGASDQTVLYRLLGSVPVRTVLESALGLPTEMQQLDLDQQARILDEKMKSQFGLSSVQDLKDPDTIDRMVSRYVALDGLNRNAAATGPAATALVLLGNAVGFGSFASQNLFLSRF
ncbi:MAG: DUF1217 domain-containing protein [Hyphomonadaceae bacterium]|nr:DUF1217 domain-containing protein [Hyphomonadaceae bacterium]